MYNIVFITNDLNKERVSKWLYLKEKLHRLSAECAGHMMR